MTNRKPTAPVKSTTQDFIEIKEIADDVVLLKDGSAVMILETSAINFSLLSEEEQDSLIYAFGSLLNSLSFAIQILIMSNKMNVSDYLEYLTHKLNDQHDQIIHGWLEKYMDFIKAIVTKNTILKKRFFIMVPFSTLEMGIKGAVSSSYTNEYLIQRAKTSLYPKRDHILRLLARIGLKAAPLTRTEMVNFFYNLYNPSSTGMDLVDPAMFESYMVHGS